MKKLKQLLKNLNIRNSCETMKRINSNSFAQWRHRFMPWRPYPDCSQFKVDVKKYNTLFLEHGIKLRGQLRADGSIESPDLYHAKWKNRKFNRYMLHQIERLRKARDAGNHKLYWIIGKQLLKYSNIFALNAVMHIYPRFHREQPYSQLLRLVWGSHSIAQSGEELSYKRVYIPKPDGGQRPLGVPTPSWRVYLYQLNNLLLLWLEKEFHPNQHGFLPGRGTLTAWKQILTQVINKPDIFEFDYRGFFNGINIIKTLGILKSKGLDEEIHTHLLTISRSIPELTDSDPIHEPDREVLYTGSLRTNPNAMVSRMTFEKQFENQWKALLGDGYEIFKSQALKGWEETLEDGTKQEVLQRKTSGFPQGANISPLLSIIPLMELDKQVNVHRSKVRYADDFLEYPRGSTKQWTNLPGTRAMLKVPKAYKDFGIEINTDKSGWIKFRGKWLKPLRFLGLTYDGVTDTLTASTRNGATLELSDQTALLERILANPQGSSCPLKSEGCPGPSRVHCSKCGLSSRGSHILSGLPGFKKWTWQQFVNHKLVGFFQSRMYQDSWNVKDFVQSFDMKYTKGSWMFQAAKYCNLGSLDDITVFNSTSFAATMILTHLKSINKLSWLKKGLQSGTLSLEEVNERRKWMGLPPLTEFYVRRLLGPAGKRAAQDKRAYIQYIRANRDREHTRYSDWLYLNTHLTQQFTSDMNCFSLELLSGQTVYGNPTPINGMVLPSRQYRVWKGRSIGGPKPIHWNHPLIERDLHGDTLGDRS